MQENIQVERRKKGLYKVLFDVAFEAVIIIDLDTYDIIDANPKSLKMFEYSLDELLHLKITDLSVDPKQTEIHLANENVHCIELAWYKKKNNIKFPVEVTGARLTYEDKNLMVFNIKDLTERFQKRKIEEDLKISEKRYKAILDNLQDGFYQTDKDDNIIFVSCSALEMLGYVNRDEILGQPIKNYFLKPDTKDSLVSRLKLAGGKLYDQEVEILNKSGEVVLISLNIQVILDENGEYNGLQGTFRDITEFKRRMSEIIKLYHIVEGSQNALVLMELDGTIIYANNASLTVAHSPEWVTVEEYALGKKIKNFISFDDPINFNSVCEIINKTGKWFGSAYAFCACNNKERIPIDVMFSKIQNGGGKHYIVASYYDVSEYRKLEEKIKEQSRLYEELTKAMHELVIQMNSVNTKSYEKISHLEEAFKKSVDNFIISPTPQKGGYRINAS